MIISSIIIYNQELVNAVVHVLKAKGGFQVKEEFIKRVIIEQVTETWFAVKLCDTNLVPLSRGHYDFTGDALEYLDKHGLKLNKKGE